MKAEHEREAARLAAARNSQTHTRSVAAQDQAKVSMLRTVHTKLAEADHDYDGHRVQAMHSVRQALGHLGAPNPGGVGGGSSLGNLAQSQSDGLLRDSLLKLRALHGQLASGGGAASCPGEDRRRRGDSSHRERPAGELTDRVVGWQIPDSGFQTAPVCGAPRQSQIAHRGSGISNRQSGIRDPRTAHREEPACLMAGDGAACRASAAGARGDRGRARRWGPVPGRAGWRRWPAAGRLKMVARLLTRQAFLPICSKASASTRWAAGSRGFRATSSRANATNRSALWRARSSCSRFRWSLAIVSIQLANQGRPRSRGTSRGGQGRRSRGRGRPISPSRRRSADRPDRRRARRRPPG